MSKSSPDFRSYRVAGRPDRLLRAAVTSFCSITRPTRRETAQLDDLSGPLLASANDDTLRFVAASLSQTPDAPPVLVRRLADLPTDISAPLLLRSPVLGNIDLLALIGRHGFEHARVIAARHDLDQRIARLIASLGIEHEARSEGSTPNIEHSTANPVPSASAEATNDRPADVEAIRGSLRKMMRPSGPSGDVGRASEIRLRWDGDPGAYRKLRSTALTGVPALFQTALADALDIDLERARTIAQATGMSELIVAMRALDLQDEQAFVIVQCIWPARLAHVKTISAFFDAYEAVSSAQAVQFVSQWRAEDGGVQDHATPEAANQQPASERLKAS